MDNKKHSIEIYRAGTIGSFFLLAFLAYGFGRYYFESESVNTRYLGALLIVVNSVMVFFIGVLFRRTLSHYDAVVGNIYLFTRVFEAVALSSLVLKLFFDLNIDDDLGYFLAMVVLGLGSIPMCLTLYKYAIAPKWLALWGIIGYTIFAIGFIMALLGNDLSTYLALPAGLWEITFAFWLIIRGSKKIK
jgi:hypothetical protein